MNKVILIGRLVRDPELKYTQSNQAVCNFTLAVDKNLRKDKREEAEAAGRPTADFPRVIVWGKMAENASRYLLRAVNVPLTEGFKQVLTRIRTERQFTLLMS